MSGFLIKNSMASSLFSTDSSYSSGIYNSISEYNNIRSGNFYKLAKKYYSGDTTVSDTSSSKRVNRTEYDYKNGDYKINLQNKDEDSTYSYSTSTADTGTLAGIEKAARNLKTESQDLYTKGAGTLFKDSDYDTDRIYEAASEFVKSYNTLIDSTYNSGSSTISNAVDTMTRLTEANSEALSGIGITIKGDNKLEINPTVFKKSDIEDVKKLLNGNGSYAYQIGVSSTMIDFAAQNEAMKSNTYTGYGTYSYNYSSGSLFNYGL